MDDEDVWRKVQRVEVAQEGGEGLVPHDAVAARGGQAAERVRAVGAHVYDEELPELRAVLHPARRTRPRVRRASCRT